MTITGVVALALAIPLVVLLLLLGWPWFIGIVVAIVVAAVLVFPTTKQPAANVLSAINGRPPNEMAHARLVNLVEGLSLSTGVVEPEVIVLDDAARNAMTVADPSGVTLVITQGLVEALDRMQLEGVVAELLVRAKDGDAELGTEVASLVDRCSSGVLKPFSSFVVGRSTALFDEDRDLLADQAAVGVTRYPPALASAFATLRSGSLQPSCATPSNAHLWLVPHPTALVPSHPLDLRIDVLEEI
ncbi:MAG: hypothetical protein R2733_25260 [Acidimicrobiales bacterium]